MAIIAPVGNMEFNWSPREKSMTKVASTGTQAQETDKDLLFAAAKSFLGKKAQFEMINDEKKDETNEEPCDPCQEPTTQVGEIAKSKKTEVGADAQQAVTDLVDTAKKAQEVVEKVEQAVSKVEEAVQEVKNAVGAEVAEAEEVEGEEGAETEEVPEEVEIEITDEEVPEGETEVEVEDAGDEVEVEVEGKDEVKVDVEDEGKKEDEIVQESCMASKKVEMKSAGSSDGMVKIAKLSPSVRKKVYEYWKNELGYVPDFCKLLVQDN